MSEPRANPPDDEGTSVPPDGPRPDSFTANPVTPDPAASLLNAGVAPTDDAPTVISKTAPKSAPAEDAFAGGLRGRRLAHFELIEPIGVGGMAAVIRARDTQLDREVALKILPPEMAADAENIRRFHQEARSAAKLDHDSIARVFFCGEDQRLHFIAFEFVEGENLRVLIEKRGRLPAGEGVLYLLQIASGLVHASGRGVVHRDIKPSNIIISPSGRAKLVDMGLARSLERSHADDGLTQSGVTLGTFDYISPEQALEPREADTRSDIYSLGCTFYHALTGQPPVPEGTAAKKLHHHHYIKPVDPRQLAPDLPDVVAGILGRMMAKQAGDRYQSPEELVQQLVLAARALGVNPEVPEGLPPTATTWSGPPAGKPLVLVGLAALLVVGLIVFTDPGGTSTPSPSVTSVRNPEGGDKGPIESVKPEKEKGSKSSPPPLGPKLPTPVQLTYDGLPQADALMQWAADAKASGATELVIPLSGDLTLVADDPKTPLPLFEATKVTVRPRFPGQRPTIKLSHHGTGQSPQQTWAALTIAGDDVTVEGVRFVVDALGGNYDMVGLRLIGKGRYRVRDCEFVQVMPSFDPIKRLASVRAEATNGRSFVHLEECCFLGYMAVEEVTQPHQPASLRPLRMERGGQDAIVRRGAVRVEAVNCAFGPHAADFRFEGAPAVLEDGRADIRHCSILAGAESAAFDLAERASADLRVEACLFSRPTETVGGMGTERRLAVLVRQSPPAGNVPVIFRGKDNRYHNLDGFWSTADGSPLTEWIDFPRKLEETGGSDLNGRLIVDANPWKASQPLKLLEQPPPDRPGQAFRPNERLADLRISSADGRETIAGVERLAGDDFVAGLQRLSPQKSPLLTRHERLVDPSAEEDPDHRVYNQLEAAIVAAAPGDVILIRHQGRLPVEPIHLEKRTVNLAIRPAPGFRPELAPTDTAGVAALFNLRDGWLQLTDLEFSLKPGPATRSLALVALSGSGRCTLKGCVVTLDPANTGVPLAVATVPETSGGMEARPQLSLEGCFIRGEGDVVRDRSGRPFELTARNTLAVLTGSFLSVESSADAAPPGQSVKATLGKVTTYLTDHLVRLQSDKDQRGPMPVQCDAKACLFVAAASKSLIHLDGPETGEDRLKDRLAWTGEGNAYANLKDRMFDQVEPGDEMAMPGPTVGAERWKSLFKEDENAQFLLAVPFAAAPTADSFPRVEPPQMRAFGNSLKEIGAGKVPMPASGDR